MLTPSPREERRRKFSTLAISRTCCRPTAERRHQPWRFRGLFTRAQATVARRAALCSATPRGARCVHQAQLCSPPGSMRDLPNTTVTLTTAVLNSVAAEEDFTRLNDALDALRGIDLRGARVEIFQILVEQYSDTGDKKQIVAGARRRLATANAGFGPEGARATAAGPGTRPHLDRAGAPVALAGVGDVHEGHQAALGRAPHAARDCAAARALRGR